MKVICERGALFDALNLAGAVVLARTPKPVLLCVKLTAADGVLRITSTDLEVGLNIVVRQVEVEEEGEALVPSDKLLGIVRESSDATLTFATEDSSVHVRGSDSHFQILGHTPSEYPPVQGFEGDPTFTIKAGMLSELIARTLFATARENSRYAINGVLMEREGRKLVLVATDGRRLAFASGTCDVEGDDEAPTENSVIIPTKAFSLLGRLIHEPEEDVFVRLDDNEAVFGVESASIATSLVEGTFPPYREVIPKDQDKRVHFATSELMSGVRRAALLTNEESKGVCFSLEQDQMVLSSHAPEMGHAEVKVPIKTYNGEPVKIGFNPTFVVDALKVVDAEEVVLELKSSNKPGILKAGSGFLYVIMPVNL